MLIYTPNCDLCASTQIALYADANCTITLVKTECAKTENDITT